MNLALKRMWCHVWGHSAVPIERLSRQSVKLSCERCGGLYAYNSDVGVLLPWHMVSSFYEEFPELSHSYKQSTGEKS